SVLKPEASTSVLTVKGKPTTRPSASSDSGNSKDHPERRPGRVRGNNTCSAWYKAESSSSVAPSLSSSLVAPSAMLRRALALGTESRTSSGRRLLGTLGRGPFACSSLKPEDDSCASCSKGRGATAGGGGAVERSLAPPPRGGGSGTPLSARSSSGTETRRSPLIVAVNAVNREPMEAYVNDKRLLGQISGNDFQPLI